MLRNPPGFNHFLKSMNDMREAADSLDQLSTEKWQGLREMDKLLENTFVNSEKDRLRLIATTALRARRIQKKKSVTDSGNVSIDDKATTNTNLSQEDLRRKNSLRQKWKVIKK